MYTINEELKKQIIQEERLTMIRNIMKTLNVSSELAMEILDMSKQEKEYYQALLLN